MITAFCLVTGLTLPGQTGTPLALRSREVRMNLFGQLQKGFYSVMAGEYDAAQVTSTLQDAIARRPCLMYSDSQCPTCLKAKNLLNTLGTMKTVVDLDELEEGMAMRAELIPITSTSALPAVFIGGKFVGDYDAMADLHRVGKLKELLTQAGALAKDRV
mmetsp:Transcript_37582/g.62235  ORF Transcript_37582/g.62235 Transcript_37582/m.62235 type:complete len:159 (+) Transcript_37582:26-502(+)